LNEMQAAGKSLCVICRNPLVHKAAINSGVFSLGKQNILGIITISDIIGKIIQEDISDKNSFEVLKRRLELGKMVGRQNTATIRFGSFADRRLREIAQATRERVAKKTINQRFFPSGNINSVSSSLRSVTFSPYIHEEFSVDEIPSVDEFRLEEGGNLENV